jgi:hypothetical protein
MVGAFEGRPQYCGILCSQRVRVREEKVVGNVASSDIALNGELPEAAGFAHVEIVDSGSDLNAYAKVEMNKAGGRGSQRHDWLGEASRVVMLAKR